MSKINIENQYQTINIENETSVKKRKNSMAAKNIKIIWPANIYYGGGMWNVYVQAYIGVWNMKLVENSNVNDIMVSK